MMSPDSIFAIGGLALVGLLIAAAAGLKGWQGWIELRKLEIASLTGGGPGGGGTFADPTAPRIGGRIEIADLKERVRKLEQIASGIDL